jgi:hypothetical protein
MTESLRCVNGAILSNSLISCGFKPHASGGQAARTDVPEDIGRMLLKIATGEAVA